MEDITVRGKGGRQSARSKDAESRRVLDEGTRTRRKQRHLESFENDNFHEDPHNQFVKKKLPSFDDGEGPSKGSRRRLKAGSNFKMRVRRNFASLLEEANQLRQHLPEAERMRPSYTSAAAPPSKLPKRHFCSACGFPSNYTCVSCGARFCCVRCQGTHRDTRCLKWTV